MLENMMQQTKRT